MLNRTHFLRCLFALALLTTGLGAGPWAEGRGRDVCPNQGEPLTLFTYKPAGYREGPLLVICHGVGRNAEEYRDFAVTLADRMGALLVAPLFDRDRFPTERYQRGGLVDASGRAVASEAWTYTAIPRIVAHVREREGRPALPYYLVGHSAGGQFLVRMAAFLPGDAVRIIAANPGSHLFPTRDQTFGYGFGGLPSTLSNDDVLRRYLAAPLTLYLGTDDIYPRPSFDGSPAAMQQGANRLERGRACFAAAEALARARGWPFHWRKVETPGIGHDAAAMFSAREAVDAILGR